MKYNHIDFTDFPDPMSVPGTISPSEFLLNNTMLLLGCFLIFLVLLKMISMVMSYRTYTRQEKERALVEASRRSAEKIPPAFASAAHADAVFLYANRSLYQFLLAELRRVLKDEGYIMMTNRHQHANIGTDSWDRIARHLFLARQQFLARSGVDQSAFLAEKNQSEEARELFLCLAKGCSDTGWYIARPEADAYGKPDEASQ